MCSRSNPGGCPDDDSCEVFVTKKLTGCRICGNRELVEVLDLGVQALTGVFPQTKSQPVTSGPLRLVKCMGDDVCGLLQLQHSYDLGEMYGLNYGYRSGLNQSMVEHLHGKVRAILPRVQLSADSLVIDIGSNDSTTLQAYPRRSESRWNRSDRNQVSPSLSASHQVDSGFLLGAPRARGLRFQESRGDHVLLHVLRPGRAAGIHAGRVRLARR